MYLGIMIEITTSVRWGSSRMDELLENCVPVIEASSMVPFGPAWNRALRSRDYIRAILADIVKERLRTDGAVIDAIRAQDSDLTSTRRISLNSDIDVLHIALAKSELSTAPGADLDDEVIGALARTILLLVFAGFSDTSVESASASFELGWDAQLYARLTEEQDELVAASGEIKVSMGDLKQMPLLDGFLMEILRLRPSANGTGRRAAQDVELLGMYVPKGEDIFLDFFTAHRNPTLYPNPEKIDPERWSRTPKPPPLLAFGAPGSPHYCIGHLFAKVLLKTAFATLLRRYTYKLDPAQSREYQPFEAMPFSQSVPKSLVVVEHFTERVKK